MVITRRFVILLLFLLFFGMQLIQPERVNPEVTGPISAPPRIMEVLKRTCFECHSNETEWPWFSQISPISWWVASTVERGRTAMNFSEWNAYSRAEQTELYNNILTQTEDGSMPPWYYVILHPRANLKLEDRERFRAWVKDHTGNDPLQRIR